MHIHTTLINVNRDKFVSGGLELKFFSCDTHEAAEVNSIPTCHRLKQLPKSQWTLTINTGSALSGWKTKTRPSGRCACVWMWLMDFSLNRRLREICELSSCQMTTAMFPACVLFWGLLSEVKIRGDSISIDMNFKPRKFEEEKIVRERFWENFEVRILKIKVFHQPVFTFYQNFIEKYLVQNL